MKVTMPVPARRGGWAQLARPEVLAAALPGCRSASRADDGGVRIVVDVAVASVRGLWAGTLTEIDVRLWQIVGAGEPGRVDLVVSVDDDFPIRVDDDYQVLTVEGTVEGPLAAIGSALLAAAVRRLVEDTLARAER